MKALLLVWLLCLLPMLAPAQAADVLTTFENEEQSQLYFSLLKEYRCLKCQNQNLADSHASLADDLRREIRLQILDGKGKNEIDEYLVARYGEFVLYRPRFSAKTLVLWLGPFALLLIGLGSVYLTARRRKTTDREQQIAAMTKSSQAAEQHAARLERARKLLGD
ncbi:cytochrome c-type biogenesis protein [Granulosicoccus antarcticus]|uniref:Cytochrome c-type biogenesis protein n=1 Tax=Granulosicoccus antarcticus IMCC3135 TaxID=1192854 RepID=A0A2Z2P536_9GAMM|nr:cytochrome c-type biogenesis protein [Granulosicoccus antarcticus]ASJ74944.1 Cytochrome c-type biogenesis protein CcmH [Granulosicoccus antarcticus IMCC3135]